MKRKSANSLSFVIHDLNPWGGQDKVTLELARRLAKREIISIFAFTLQDPEFTKFKPLWPSRLRPVLFKSIYFHLRSLLLHWRPDTHLIHAAGACTLVSDVVQVHFVHRAWKKRSHELPSKKENFFRAVYRSMLERYDLLSERLAYRPHKTYLAVSHRVKEELRVHYPALHHVEVVHPGVDFQAFHPEEPCETEFNLRLRKTLAVEDRDLLLLFVGSFERKGLDTLLEGLKAAADSRVRLLVIGAGDVRSYEQKADELGILRQVQFLGRKSDLRPYYQIADFFVLPTRYEPFGLVVLEAMACGLVPAVSARAGAAELIESGKNGFVIQEETSVSELCSLILKMRELKHSASGSELRTLKKNALEVATGQSWDRVADRYSASLQRVRARRSI